MAAVVIFAAAAAAQAPAWVSYRSPDGQFSARFPVSPAVSTQQSKNKDGEPLTQHMVSAMEGDAVFLLGYFEILSGQVFTISEARDGMLRNVNGTLLSETAITLGAYSGTDLVLTADAQGNSYVMNVRVIHTPRRAYVIQAIFLRTAPHQSEKTARFFSSFQITP
jgi:hypothetical protein